MITYEMNCGSYDFHNGFGIDAFKNGLLIKSVCNITTNEYDMAELVTMCNELELELCHLDDIVEDYLTDFCI